MKCRCQSCPSCERQAVSGRRRRWRVSGVTGAQSPTLTRPMLDKRVRALDSTIRGAGLDVPAWSEWLGRWRAGQTGTLTDSAEQLARLAEQLGGALSGKVQVAGNGLVQPSREVMAFESGLDSVLNAIAPVLPYGREIQAVHRARRGIMYGDTGTGDLAGKVREAQAATRAARLGESGAKQRVESAKRTDSATSRIYDAVRRDDSKRIEAAYRARGGA